MASTLTTSTLSAAAGYAAYKLSWAVQKLPKSLSQRQKIDWHMRNVSTIWNMVHGCGAAYLLWKSREWSLQDRLVDFPPDVERLGRIFLGYIVYDLALLIRHHRHLKDYQSLVHHTLFLSIGAYCARERIFPQAFLFLTVGELSTPLLNLRWQLRTLGLKESPEFAWVNKAFTALFFGARVVTYGAGLAWLWHVRPEWAASEPRLGKHLVVGGISLGYLLNLVWFSLVFKKALRRSKPGKAFADAAAPPGQTNF